MNQKYYDVVDHTWPPVAKHTAGGFTLRQAPRAAGKRVSCATLDAQVETADIVSAEAAMRAMSQPCLFMIRAQDHALDQALAERGYAVIDPVTIYTINAAEIARPLPPITCFEVFPPLAIMRDIWETGGLGPARIDVMTRTKGAKTAIFARTNDRAAGVAYVGLHGDTTMLHALEVKKSARRQGVAVNIMRAAANWTLDQGGKELCLVVLTSNAAACAVYTSLGMKPVGQYHYRMLNPEGSL